MAKSTDPDFDLRSDEPTGDGSLEQIRQAMDEGLLPLTVFNDPDLHDLEMARLFAREWIFIGHETEIPEEGDYAKRYVGTDPFIFVRDSNGDVQVLFDSCRHRGTHLCQAEEGNTSHFRCPYHGWVYKNTGELVGVPQKDTAFKELDKEEFGLHPAPRVDSYEGLVFASLADEGESLEEHLGDFTWYLDINLKLPDGGMEVVGKPTRWTVDMNWKTSADNFMGIDSYHTGFAHRSIVDMELGSDEVAGVAGASTTKDRHVHCDGHSTSTRMIEGESVFMTYPEEVQELFSPENLSEEQYRMAKEALSFTGGIFPNFGFIHFGDVTDDPEKPPTGFLTVRKWQPIAPDKTQIWSWFLAPKEAPEAVKKRLHRVYMTNFGPTGNFEQDDLNIWKGITGVADSEFAAQHDLNVTYLMAKDEMSEVSFDEEWPGPGTVFATNLEEYGFREFHENWYDRLAEPT